MKEIRRVALSRLTSGAHFTFMSNILARAEADAAVADKAGAQVRALRAAVEEEDGSMGLSRKSLLTDDIVKADRRRGALYSGYRKAVEGIASMADTDMGKTAKALMQHIRDFGIRRDYQLDRETGLLTNFIADLQGRHAAQVEALSLTAFVTGMKEANDRVREYTLRRTEERTGVRVGAFKAARAAADAAYRDLARMVNALAVVLGETGYAAFIDYCNTEIASFRRQTFGKKASATGRKKVLSADTETNTAEMKTLSAGTETKTAEMKVLSAGTETKTAEMKVLSAGTETKTAETKAKTSENKASLTKAKAKLTENKASPAETKAKTTVDKGNSEGEEDTTT